MINVNSISNFSEGTVEIDGESIPYCWIRIHNSWRISVRVQDDLVRVPGKYPPGSHTDCELTQDIIKDWLNNLSDPEKFEFLRRLKEQDRAL